MKGTLKRLRTRIHNLPGDHDWPGGPSRRLLNPGTDMAHHKGPAPRAVGRDSDRGALGPARMSQFYKPMIESMIKCCFAPSLGQQGRVFRDITE